jgi:hypothetical protein
MVCMVRCMVSSETMHLGSCLIVYIYKTRCMVAWYPPYLHTRAHVRTRPQETKTTYGNFVAP